MTTEKIKNNYTDDVRVALLEQSINNINDTLVRFEKRFDKIDERLDKVETNVKLEIRWIITVFGSLMLGLAGLMAHGFHWV